jgi:hypothetical protein
MSREILTNPNFDFSQVTWENIVEMTSFWRCRFAKPSRACRAWVVMIRSKCPTLYNRLGGALLDGITIQQREDYNKYFSHLWRKKFYSTHSKDQVPVLEDFDEVEAEKQYGIWIIQEVN